MMDILKKLHYLMAILVIALVAACGNDDDCTVVTWFEDADGDGLGNPAVSLMECDQPMGYVSNNLDTNDALDSNCSFADDPRCYCTINPDDLANCTQLLGDSLFYNGFESFTSATLLMGDLEHSDREFENYGSLNGGDADGVTAVQGTNYLSFIVDPYTTELRPGFYGPRGHFLRQTEQYPSH